MSPVTPPTEDDEKSLRIDTGSPPTPQKIPGQRISSKDPSKDYLDVTEECQPKPQAVVPPMHSETSPVSNDDNRGLVSGCKFYGSIFLQTFMVSRYKYIISVVPRHPVTCQGMPASMPDAPLPLQSVLTASLSSPQPQQVRFSQIFMVSDFDQFSHQSAWHHNFNLDRQ